jgi:predicted CXXCH cytochrome family protein
MRGWHFALMLSCALAVACGNRAKSPAISNSASGVVSSNITRDDYAGSKSCASCHAEIYATWMRAPMHDMTRLPAGLALDAPFDGRTFHFKNDSAILETKNGERFMRIVSQKEGSSTYRVTKVIGGHYREDFAGLQIDANGNVVGDAHDEMILPVSYVLGTKSLRYKGYSVMTPNRDGLHAGPVWNRTCIFCHNTAPYLSSMLGALAGPDAKPYQGEVVDPLLPPKLRESFALTDEDAAKEALSAEISVMHKTPEKLDSKSVHDALLTTLAATRANFWEKDLLEVGIGCESCHGGSKEHVRNPKVLPSFSPHSAFARVAGEHSASDQITRTCGRCHQVLFSGYPFTWEGGARSDKTQTPGGSHINSGEARDLLLGDCASKISCVDCHDPHAPGNAARIRELEDTLAGNAVCLRCHASFASEDAQRAHTHHDPKGEGGKCMNCHVAKKNMSLDGKTTRYHRIGSPTDRDRVENDRPLECALCHEKKTVRELLTAMKNFWNVSFDENKVASLYAGNLEQNAILATLANGKPHEKAPALFIAGQTKMLAAAGYAAQEMTGPYPIVRGYAERALESIYGEVSPVDPLAEDDPKIAAATRDWLARHESKNEKSK